MLNTLDMLIDTDFPAIRRCKTAVLQANLGYRCNQSCLHCHVAAGPRRKEQMSWDTMTLLLDFCSRQEIGTLDLTGGAPEMNPHFRRLVSAARAQGIHVLDRCNLSILNEPDQENLADFLAANQVEIIASLPCYLEENVDKQRGKGVFESSLTAMKKLNALGYGQVGSGLLLNLVYNPAGSSLPPEQSALQSAYKEQLATRYGIVFNKLYALANMPINRFGSQLLSNNQFQEYMALLKASSRPENVDNVMCRSLVSIDWQGRVYDCDFNQMLGLPLGGKQAVQISDIFDARLEDQSIHIADHCYGCTAGQGSSCGGALA